MTQFSVLSQLMDRALDRSLPSNIVEKDDAFEISVRVPGIARKDIAVDIQGRFVKVSINKLARTPEPGATAEQGEQNAAQPTIASRVVHMAEFDVPAKAERMFQFRETLDAEAASLDLTDGILKITVGYLQRGTKRTLTLGD